MMKVFCLTQVQENYDAVFEAAKKDGKVCIKNRNGELFFLHSMANQSPLDIEGVALGYSSDEIVALVRKGRAK